MGQLQERYKKYREPQKFIEAGVYPYFRTITSKQGTEVEMDGHKVLMFGSNAYTGLTGDPRVIEAAKQALDKYGSGCAGSRFLNGTLDLHVQLEKELAEAKAERAVSVGRHLVARITDHGATMGAWGAQGARDRTSVHRPSCPCARSRARIPAEPSPHRRQADIGRFGQFGRYRTHIAPIS